MAQLLVAHLTITLNGSSLFTLQGQLALFAVGMMIYMPDLFSHLGSRKLSWMQEAARMQKAVWK